MIRSKGEAGTGNIVEAVRHLRDIVGGIKRLGTLGPEQLSSRPPRSCAHRSTSSRRSRAPAGCRCPLFCAGGIATPADAALTMQLGAEGNFVGSGIFKSSDPERTARAIVEATTALQRPRAGRGRVDGPRRGDARRRHRRADGTGRAAAAARGLTLRIGVLASQGDFAAHASDAAGLGADPVEVRTPGDARRARRPRDPRRGVDDDDEGDRARRARAGDPQARRPRAARSSAPAPG